MRIVLSQKVSFKIESERVMNRVPYIGVTGFAFRVEVEQILGNFPDAKKNAPKLMIGVLMNDKTLAGKETRRSHRYPPRNKVQEIFCSDGRVMNILHYHTDNPGILFWHLLMMTTIFSRTHMTKHNLACANGIQLNFTWPAVYDLKISKKEIDSMVTRKFEIILQVGPRAFEQVDNSPTKLVERLREYEGVVDYVLLDKSGGEGKIIDVDFMRRCIEEVRDSKMDFGITVAGGLCPETLPRIEPLIVDFPDTSIDAEGRLRNTTDDMNLSVAEDYVIDALEMYAGARK